MSLETPIWVQGGTYSARLDRSLLDVIFTEGVINPGGSALAVTQRSTGANDSVDVVAGAAIISGDDEADQGKYYVRNTGVVNVAFTPAPGSDQRIDLLVLQVNDPTAGGAAGDDAVFLVIEGTPAGTAVAPAVPDTAIPLAEVLRLSSDTSIVNAAITDRRPTSSTANYTVNSSFEILTTTERNALTPFEGQVIFNSTDDIAQYYDGSVWVNVGQLDLDDLGDVDASSPSDREVLAYNSGSGNWEAIDLRVAVTNAQTGTTYTLALTDLGKLVELNNASPITLTVPTNASVAFPVGSRIDLLQTGAGQVTVAAAGGVTLNSSDSKVKLKTQWSAATLIKRATDAWVLVGEIVA